MKSNLMIGLAISSSISVIMMGAVITERVHAQSTAPAVEFPPLENLERPMTPARPRLSHRGGEEGSLSLAAVPAQ
jgi:hypothetical protein